MHSKEAFRQLDTDCQAKAKEGIVFLTRSGLLKDMVTLQCVHVLALAKSLGTNPEDKELLALVQQDSIRLALVEQLFNDFLEIAAD